MSEDHIIGMLEEYELVHVEWQIPYSFLEHPFQDFKHYSSPTFTFAESKFKLIMQPAVADYVRCKCISIRHSKSFPVKHKLGLKRADGTMEYFSSNRDIRRLFPECAESLFIPLKNLVDQRHKLVPFDIVTVMCILRFNLGMADKKSESPQLAPLKLIGLNTLSENYKSIFADKGSCDVILKVKEKEFHVHKIVLMARSTAFAAMFHHDMSENQTGIISIPDCDPDSFHEFLEYLYCGQIEGISFNNALHLYSTSDKYDIQELKSFCIKCMKQYLTKDNVCDVVILADLYDENELLSEAQDFFNKNADKVTETVAWENLMKSNYRLANKLIKEMISKNKIAAHDSSKPTVSNQKSSRSCNSQLSYLWEKIPSTSHERESWIDVCHFNQVPEPKKLNVKKVKNQSSGERAESRSALNCSKLPKDIEKKAEHLTDEFLLNTDSEEFESTVSQAKVTPNTEITMEEIGTKLSELLGKNESNESIFDYIDIQVLPSEVCEPAFIRVLSREVHKAAITRNGLKLDLEQSILIKRIPLLSRYIDYNENLELQALYAVQHLMTDLNHPKAVLRQIFDLLYDYDVISEKVFKTWENSDDPAELEDKGVVLNSVRGFFTWLRETEDSVEEAED